MGILAKLKNFFKKAFKMNDKEDEIADAIGEIAIISGAAILGYLYIKALFKRDTFIHRCPKCDLVVMKNAFQCRRCGTILDWEEGDKKMKGTKCDKAPDGKHCWHEVWTGEIGRAHV